MKKCYLCNEEKSYESFSKDKYNKDGYRRCCKNCASKKHREWREINKDTLATKQRKMWQEMPEIMRTRTKKSREKNKDAIKERRLKKYANNLQLVLFRSSKNRAKTKRLEHSITIEDIVIPSICPVLGIPIFYSPGKAPSPNSPSIDRINNAKGYIKGNILVISWRANNLKRDASMEELQMIVDFYKKRIK